MAAILAWAPNLIEAPSVDVFRRVDRMVSPSSSFVAEPRTPDAGVTMPYRLFLDGRAAIVALEAWFDSVQGSLVPVWVPSYQHDLELALATAALSDDLVIRAIDYTARWFPLEARRHICYIAPNGTITPYRLRTSADNGDGTETVTRNPGVAYPAGTVFSMMRLCRLADDTLVLTRDGATLAEATLRFTEVPREVTTAVT